MTSNNELAALLGKKLWTTNSFLPQYQSGEVDAWRINPGGQLVNDWGYYTGPCLLEMLPSLLRKVEADHNDTAQEGWEVWMSLTPHEIESQELGYLFAFGEVVVMGLGMGWVAANIALNPAVNQVTVIERDPAVLNLFEASGAYQSIPQVAQQKIKLIQADALLWAPELGQKIDFLYADIWLHLAEPEAYFQVVHMQRHVQAQRIYYWGQEMAIHSAIQRLGLADQSLNIDSIKLALRKIIKLPLLIPDDRHYGEMIEKVIKNRTERGLSIAINFA